MSLELTFQKSGWYRQNQNAILRFVFITLCESMFSCFPKYRFPPNLEARLQYCFCEVLYSQSFVNNGINNSRLHSPFMPADGFSSEDMFTFLRISNLLRVKMELCSKSDIAHYFTYFDYWIPLEYKFNNWNIIS